MKIDKYYHLYSRKLDVMFEEIPNPVRRGQWKHDKDDVIISGYCSECGWTSIICETDVAGMSYCPNCGAKMEENR